MDTEWQSINSSFLSGLRTINSVPDEILQKYSSNRERTELIYGINGLNERHMIREYAQLRSVSSPQKKEKKDIDSEHRSGCIWRDSAICKGSITSAGIVPKNDRQRVLVSDIGCCGSAVLSPL